MSWEMKGYRRFWISLALGLQNITEYMIIGKPLKLSLVWDVVGHSSLNRSEVIWEWTQMLDTERQKMRREEQVLGSLTKWKKSWKSLIKFEISLSKNIKENVSKFGILWTLSQLYLWSQNVTASIYKLTIHSVHPVCSCNFFTIKHGFLDEELFHGIIN